MAVVDLPATHWIYTQAQPITPFIVLAKALRSRFDMAVKRRAVPVLMMILICTMTHKAGENPGRDGAA
jgi:hypothetical protein